MYFELSDRFVVAAGLERTWEFFSSAENLPRITPPWLGFTINHMPAVGIEADSLLDYTIRWSGVPVRWRTRIIDWSPGRQFIDLQVRGPYALWHHQHQFAAVEGGTECSDRVTYKLPMGVVGRAAHAMLVRRQLLEIFRYRRKAIAESLTWVRAVLADVTIRKL